MHDRVHAQAADQLGEQRVAGVCVHELGAFQRHLGIVDVDPVDGGHVLARLQAARQLTTQVMADACDEDAMSLCAGYG